MSTGNAVTDFTFLVRLFIALADFTEIGIKSESNHLPIPNFTGYVITKLVNRLSSFLSCRFAGAATFFIIGSKF